MKYSDKERIKKIYEYATKLCDYINNNDVTKEKLLNDYTLQWLVTTPLYNIGEQTYYLSNQYKEQYPEISWPMISGLRHRLVHDYEGINWNIIAEVVMEEIPIFLKQIEELI